MGHEFEALSGQILEAAVDVHRILGPGFKATGLHVGLLLTFDAPTLVAKRVVL